MNSASSKRMGAVIQARMNSKRLSGKVLEIVSEAPLLEHLIRRVLQVLPKSSIVLATSQEHSDDPIAALGKRLEIHVYRGSLNDVLDRVYQAAEKFSFDPVIRITGDNPLLEPVYLRDLIELFQETNADYASAKDPALFPRGTTAEIFNFKSLRAAWENGTTLEDREHVTWYLLRNPDGFKISRLKPRKEWESLPIRLALDEPSDLELIKQVFNYCYDKNPLFGLKEISDLYYRNHKLFEINRNVLPTPTFQGGSTK